MAASIRKIEDLTVLQTSGRDILCIWSNVSNDGRFEKDTFLCSIGKLTSGLVVAPKKRENLYKGPVEILGTKSIL